MIARVRTPLTVALVFAALLLFAFIGTTVVSFPIWIRYRNAPGLSLLRSVTQIAGGLAAVGLFVTAAIVAIITALQPAGRWRKLLYVLPIYFLGFTLVGVLLYILGIGTVGSFATVWLAMGALLSIIAVAIAAVRIPLSGQALKSTITAIGITGVLSLLTWLGVVASIAIVLTSQPSSFSGGSNGPRTAPRTPSQGAAAATAAAGVPDAAEGQGQPEGDRGPGEFGGEGPGGPGGARASTTPLLIGGALMTVFVVVELASIARGRRAVSGATAHLSAAPEATRVNYQHEAGRAVFSCIAITIVGLAVAQLVPVNRTNPPVQTTVKWDSPQTQSLAQRACIDCHSNETTWPWYAYIAPGSWLLRSHVSDGRERFNISELNNVPAFEAQRLPQEVAQQIRSDAMPPSDYLILHPDAKLSNAEKQQLIQGFQKTLTATLAK